MRSRKPRQKSGAAKGSFERSTGVVERSFRSNCRRCSNVSSSRRSGQGYFKSGAGPLVTRDRGYWLARFTTRSSIDGEYDAAGDWRITEHSTAARNKRAKAYVRVDMIAFTLEYSLQEWDSCKVVSWLVSEINNQLFKCFYTVEELTCVPTTNRWLSFSFSFH